MDSYEFLVILHFIAVIVWLGAGFTMDLLFLRAEWTRNPAELGKTGELQEWLVPRLFIPASVSVLILGLLLVWDGPGSFGDLWILIGLAGWIASFAVGFLFLRPEAAKMKEIVAQYGPASAEVQRRARRLGVVARVQLLALFLVIPDMVLKPTSDDPWTLLVLAAILFAAVVLGAASLRRPLAETAPAVGAEAE
jgi:uncharacterized membrane protein